MAPRAPGLLLAIVVAGAAVVAAAVAASAPAAHPTPPPPVLAVEDTIPVPSATLPEYVVRAPRVTLDEILRRVAAGEARRDSLMQDQSYTRVALVTYLDDEGSRARRHLEVASKVFKRRPDRLREIELRRRSESEDKDGVRVEVSSSPGMGEQIVSFAFAPRARGSYRFAILERHLIGGHVIYVVGFEPRSALEPLPAGKVWIDTSDFVIVREEFWLRDRSPAPLFLKRVDRCVIERTRVDGRWWVLGRVAGRATLTSAARLLGRLTGDVLPEAMDFSVLFTEYRINEGIPDSVFAAGKR